MSSKERRNSRNNHELWLALQVATVFVNSKRRYGAGRIVDVLARQNIECGCKKVAAIMNKHGLIPVTKVKHVVTTNSNHKKTVFANLLERKFAVNSPNQVYVGDITYIRTGEGWLYLATVIDLFSRKIIGHHMSNRMTKELVITALQIALVNRGNPTGVVVHSDRGSQYASNDYKRILKEHGLIGSMSRKGDCWDNAVAESFFATLKKEYVYHSEFKTRAEAMLGIFDYIEAWYNNERIHTTLGGLSPNEFEALYSQKGTTGKKEITELKLSDRIVDNPRTGVSGF